MKRCTNSACRRYFREDVVCPYCGKEYPRFRSSDWDLVLENIGQNKIKVIRACREVRPLGLREAKALVDSVAVTGAVKVLDRVSREDAEKGAAYFAETGAKVTVVHHRRSRWQH